MAEVMSSVVNNLLDFKFHIFSHFLRIIIFHESPNGFYSDTHHKSSLYFNFSRKVLSLPIRLRDIYLKNSLQNRVVSRGHDDPSPVPHRKFLLHKCLVHLSRAS